MNGFASVNGPQFSTSIGTPVGAGYYGPGSGYGERDGGGFFGFLGFLFVLGGLFFLARSFLRNAFAGGPAQSGWNGPSRRGFAFAASDGALGIARERLARGEITPEEFEEIKRGLER